MDPVISRTPRVLQAQHATRTCTTCPPSVQVTRTCTTFDASIPSEPHVHHGTTSSRSVLHVTRSSPSDPHVQHNTRALCDRTCNTCPPSIQVTRTCTTCHTNMSSDPHVHHVSSKHISDPHMNHVSYKHAKRPARAPSVLQAYK